MRAPTIEQLARSVGASKNTLYRWQREEGVDIRDPEALKRRAGMMPPKDELPPKSFGQKLREVLENMPHAVIRDLDAATNRAERMKPLCRWVGLALRDLLEHPDHPKDLPLTPEEKEETRAFIEEWQRDQESAE